MKLFYLSVLSCLIALTAVAEQTFERNKKYGCVTEISNYSPLNENGMKYSAGKLTDTPRSFALQVTPCADSNEPWDKYSCNQRTDDEILKINWSDEQRVFLGKGQNFANKYNGHVILAGLTYNQVSATVIAREGAEDVLSVAMITASCFALD